MSVTDTRFFLYVYWPFHRDYRDFREETLNRMFTRVRSGETDNAHAFLSTEYIIFWSFFVFSLRVIIIMFLFYFSVSLFLVCITFGQQNRNNGSTSLHKYMHRNMSRFVRRDYSFLFSNAYALQKCFIIYFTVW